MPRPSRLPRLCFVFALFAAGISPRPWAQWFGDNKAEGGLSKADSLASFRPDSVDTEKFRQVESGSNAQDTLGGKSDTAAKANTQRQFLKRPPYLALHAGVGFLDLSGREKFIAALESEKNTSGSRILQPYESVNLYFPAGILAGLPVFPYADMLVKSHSYWFRQVALLGDSLSGAGQEEFFAVQGHLAGLGLRLYVPQEILAARGRGNIYFELTRFVDLAANEIYTGHGSAPARWQATGSATEIQLGFMHSLNSKWTWSAALSYFSSEWASRKSWNEILPIADQGRVRWGGNALQMRFFLFWGPGILFLRPT